MSKEDKYKKGDRFYSSKDEIKSLMHITETVPESVSRLAFLDREFLLSPEMRAIRLSLEFLKCELYLKKNNVHKLITIIGGSRIVDPFWAQQQVADLKKKIKTDPENTLLHSHLKAAEISLKNSIYYHAARKLAALLSDLEIEGEKVTIATGGGPGIMEAANRGAKENGRPSMGMSIMLPTEQQTNYYVDPHLNFYFHYFSMRKMHMVRNCHALVVFPGGFGTIDEFFEVLNLLSTQKMKPTPVVLFGKEFWSRVVNFEVLIEEGMIREKDLNLFKVLDTPEDVMRYISDFYTQKKGRYKASHQ